MDEFEKFRCTFLQLVFEMVGSKLVEAGSKAEENLAKVLLDIETYNLKVKEWSQRDIFLKNIFYEFIEIDSSYSILRDIELYIERFPHRHTSMSRSRYIEYHIANYLNEIYILKNRLTKYAKKLYRLYKKDPRHETIKKLTDGISKIIENGFNNIVIIRGTHVHEYRYMDKDILRLGAIESLIERGDDTFVRKLNPEYKRIYKKIKNDWSIKIQENNKEIRKIISSYFKALSKVLFDRKGKLICP